jgi:hypothetical protein
MRLEETGSRVQLANGGESESHVGFRGSEDIGGGASVILQLEDRFFRTRVRWIQPIHFLMTIRNPRPMGVVIA